MRASELASVRLEDVDLDRGLIRIVPGTTKGRRMRIVHISPQAVRYIDRYLRKRRPDHPAAGYLFAGQRGPFRREGLYDLVRRTFEAAKAPAVIGPHDLRHTSASHVAGEIGEADMMALYGWKDAEMARHYTSQARERLALEAHAKASPLANLMNSNVRRVGP